MIPKERVFVDYAKQVLGRRVNDATFTAIDHLVGPQGAVGLTVVVGYYGMLCSIGGALGLELPDGVEHRLPI